MATTPGAAKTILLTSLAMLAFAANSLLCRLALGQQTIDAASFTTVRLVSGALTLWLIVQWMQPRRDSRHADWTAAVMLFLYAVAFSFAYISLSAGTGALILFGMVQLTMFIVGLRAGEHFSPLCWTGLTLAVAGLVYLVFPGVTAPSPIGAGLMAIAGIAWGVYSLRGRGIANALQATAGNFARAAPMTVLASLFFIGSVKASPTGVALAVASGAVASGVGYFIWYAALRGLTATRAAVVQLSVPVIAAIGGVMLLAEDLSVRLLISSMATLGGIALVLTQHGPRQRTPSARPVLEAATSPVGDEPATRR